MERKCKIRNKMISILAIIIILINIVNISRASSIRTSVTVNLKQKIDIQYSYNGDEKVASIWETTDNLPVYAMIKDNESIHFWDNNISIYKNEGLKNILKNGYGCKNMYEIGCANPVEAFLATQEAIYIYNENRNIENYVIDPGKTARLLDVAQTIVEKAAKEPKDVLEVNSNFKGWKEWTEDTNYKYMEYSINSNNEEIGSIKITRGNDVRVVDVNTKEDKVEFNNGDKFYVVVPKNVTQMVRLKLSYEKDGTLLYIARPDGVSEYIFAEPGKETVEKNLNIDVYGNAKIKIINQDEKTNEPIVGNVFSIIKEDNSVLKQGLTTNQNGEINISLDNGKYYLKQTDGIDGYYKNKALIEISIDDNTEATTIKINGTKFTSEESTNINKEINITEESKNVIENNITEVSNITTTNINKEIINQINETNLHNVNNFINTINKKNVLNLEKENTYRNYIDEAEVVRNEVLRGDNENVRMTRQDYINYMDMIMQDSAKVPILPVASK